ncbi:MAG: ABC transporter ATP-binding protein [Bdellovibrionales bacterium]|nr:ABC transporter ATP-binding protein [Bdellovibrionales bacterium]
MTKTKKENANLNGKQLGVTATQLIDRYTDQPGELPFALRNDLLGRMAQDEFIQAYAFVDLNANYQLGEGWLLVTNKHLIFAKGSCETGSHESAAGYRFRQVSLKDIVKVREIGGLSVKKYVFEDNEGDALMTIKVSYRQDRALATVKATVEAIIEGDEIFESDADKIYQNELLAGIKEAQASVMGSQMSVIWRLLSYLWPYRLQVGAGFIAAMLLTGVSLIPAYLTGYIIDSAVRPFESGALDKEQALNMAFWATGGLVLIYGLRELFGWVRLRTMSTMGELVARDLRDEVYSHLHKLSLSFFSSKQTGSLINRVSADTDRIWDFVAFGVVEVTTSVLMLTGLSAVLISLDPVLGLMVSVPVPFLLIAIYLHGERMQKLFLRAWRKWSNLTDCISDAIPGVKVVKAFHRGDEEVEKFQVKNQSVTGAFNNIHEVWTSFWPGLMLSIHAIVIAVWFFGVPRVFEGDLTAGVFVSFVLYLTMFTQPIEVIGQMARMINRATSSAHRVFEIIDTEPSAVTSTIGDEVKQLEGHVEFKNVSFSYDGVRKVIKNMSFEAKPGEMIGLVGPSGGGKSTTTSLLARFYDVNRGQILVDGKPLQDLDVGSYRSKIGIVLQDPYLFHGTVLENIRYARPEATLEEVMEAARVANAHDFICRLPYGYETVVGERGHTLSGGERQRISIARAVLRDPQLLILDEATSAVDTETEKKIQDALDRLIEGRTVFAIAHRLSTLKSADRILVIKEGEITENGTHSELMNIEEGIYKNLVGLQNEFARV